MNLNVLNSPKKTFKSNFSFISDKNYLLSKSNTHAHLSLPYQGKEIFHSCERNRETEEPKNVSKLEECYFSSRKNSVLTSMDSSTIFTPIFPQILKDIMKISTLIEDFCSSNANNSSKDENMSKILINALIIMGLELLDNNTIQNLRLNEFWDLISKHIFYDKPIQFINDFDFQMNNMQKIIIWIYLKLYEHRFEEIVSLLLNETEIKEILKNNCKIIVYENELIHAMKLISSCNYALDSPILLNFENFLKEPKAFSFSFQFSNYIKTSNDFSKKASKIAKTIDPIFLWQIKSKTLNFNEFQEKMLKKEAEELEELIYENSDYLNELIYKYFKDVPSPKDFFDLQIKKNKDFLYNLITDLKDPEKQIIKNQSCFLQDLLLIKRYFQKKLEDLQYMKDDSRTHNFQKKEEILLAILRHIEYLDSFINQIYDEFNDKYFAPDVFSGQNDSFSIPINKFIADEPKSCKAYKINFDVLLMASPGSTPHEFTKMDGNRSNNNTPFNFVRQKRSQRLFQEKFAGTSHLNFKFRAKPSNLKTIREQNNQCHKCSESIKKPFWLLGNNANLCHYTGYWYCNDCSSIENSVIPYKILEDFDFCEYTICIDGKKEIEKGYEKCNFFFSYADPLIVKNQNFYEFMILKRELHLIYDMICDRKLVENFLVDRENLLLKENLFSLKDLCQIFEGSLNKILEKCIIYFTLHFDICEHCSKKGVNCSICGSILKLYVFDIKNTEFCGICKKIYHVKCFQASGCAICLKKKK